MKQILLMIAVVLVGCEEKAPPAQPETNAELKVAAKKQEPAKGEPQKQVPPKVAASKPEPPKVFIKPGMLVIKVPGTPKAEVEIPANAFINTLGMAFVKVPATKVQFCIWETRVKDYAAYAAANDGVNEKWKEPVYFYGTSFTQPDTHPVVNVNWEDANAFCAWLTKKELTAGKIKAGQKYRLPTDAEWSIAVGLGLEKGNTPQEKDGNWLSFDEDFKSVYPWGKEWPPQEGVGNYGSRRLDLKVDNYTYTSPVGSFTANKLGLRDMGGNVWEWCEDWYDPAEKEFPVRVFRGSSWVDDDSVTLLSSARNGFSSTDYRISFVGFRCVFVGGSGR